MRYIEVSGLISYYDDEPVLEDVSYHTDAGESVILTGENGAAKSILVKTPLRLLKPSKGMIKIAEKNREGKRLSIGHTPQRVASFNAGFPSTVIELAHSGRYPRGRWFKHLSEKDHQHVQHALEATRMWDIRNRRIGELSDGRKRRVNLACIFATDLDLFILDESTTGMDEGSGSEFYCPLRHSAYVHGESVLMITHDHEDIRQYTDRQTRLARKEDSQWHCLHMNPWEEHFLPLSSLPESPRCQVCFQ